MTKGERSERWWGAGTLARAITGGHANLFAGAGLRLRCFRTHLIAVALLLGKGLALLLQVKLLGTISTAFFIYFERKRFRFYSIHFSNVES